jgi:hypothetical protein
VTFEMRSVAPEVMSPTSPNQGSLESVMIRLKDLPRFEIPALAQRKWLDDLKRECRV